MTNLNIEELKKEYDKTVERINNAEKWFIENGPVDDDSKEHRVLLALIEKANQLYYELFVLRGEKE